MKRLTLNDAIRIRVKVKCGVWTVNEAAAQYKISKQHAGDIVARRNFDWKPGRKVGNR